MTEKDIEILLDENERFRDLFYSIGENTKLLDSGRFKTLFHLQTNKNKWLAYSTDEVDKLAKIFREVNPKRVVDWGCGLGRSAINFSLNLDLSDISWELYDVTGDDSGFWASDDCQKRKGGMGTFKDAMKVLPYNDLHLTKEFCKVNGIRPHVGDLRKISDLGSPDIFYSFHCVGYHFSIKSLIENISMSPKVMIFGVRKKKAAGYSPNDLDHLEGYSKSLVKGHCLENYLVFTKI